MQFSIPGFYIHKDLMVWKVMLAEIIMGLLSDGSLLDYAHGWSEIGHGIYER